jgi:transposase-like protein
LGNVITIDDERIKSHLDRVVRGSVEETLNALLDAEADRLCNAQRYERSQARRDTRAGHYERKLQTKAGEVSLRIPKLRTQTFETAIIERYRRRESSVEEALIEMYLAGVSAHLKAGPRDRPPCGRTPPPTPAGSHPRGVIA